MRIQIDELWRSKLTSPPPIVIVLWASKLCDGVTYSTASRYRRSLPTERRALNVCAEEMQLCPCVLTPLRTFPCVTLGGGRGRDGLLWRRRSCLRHFNPSKHRTHCMYIITLCILPTQCIYLFRMVLTINSSCFRERRKVACLRNGDAIWRMPSSGMWRHVDLVNWTDVSEERIP
jgi:hypothetical protein